MSSSDQRPKSIADVVSNFRERGYEVILHPQANQLPETLQNFRPDMVVLGNNERIIVEVKSSRDRRKLEAEGRSQLAALSEALKDLPDWNIELVWLDDEDRPNRALDQREIRIWTERVRRMISTNPEAGLLLGWAALEALLRHKLADPKGRELVSVELIKTAFSRGIISRRQHDDLRGLLRIRSQVAHGFVPRDDDDPRESTRRLVEALTLLTTEGIETKRRVTKAALVAWFHKRYMDPANGVPWDGAEGGYLYTNGGPYDARDELEANFPDASEKVVAAAVSEIESDGILEWVLREDY